MAESLSVIEKRDLYQYVIDRYKQTYVRETGLSNRSGLCLFFGRLYECDLIDQNDTVFLRNEMLKYKYDNSITDAYAWPTFEYEPRLQYLENRLNYYKNLQT